MNSLGNLVGEICKVVLPINEDFYHGNPNASIAICTLSSLDLLKKISSSDLLQNVSIVGRLLSENKGIDSIIHYVCQNKKIKKIIVCGKEVWGHKAGHSLFELYKNGVNDRGRIINSNSPNPFLTVSKSQVNYFQTKIILINMINEINYDKIKEKIF